MRNNPVQFAVVREDPLVEASLLWDLPQPQKILLIASGGCTALSLQSLFPKTQFVLMDRNPAQLELVQRKIQLLRSLKNGELKSQFNIEDSRSSGINSCGNFESLFRGLREFLFEFIIPYGEMRQIFEKEQVAEASSARIFTNKYWPVGFDMHFGNTILKAMFGEQSVKHAPTETYPVYFRKAIEKGLERLDAKNNYFLHHIFLGHYFDHDAALPIYLSKPPKEILFKYHLGEIRTLKKELKDFDMISLSNIFDWMDTTEVKEIANLLSTEMKSGARLILRQLDPSLDFKPLFSDQIRFDSAKEVDLGAKDRSLFYSKINLGIKT